MRSNELTGLINQWQSGDDAALQQLIPLVHGELQRLARRQMRGEASSHTLQATALVNEAFMRLADIKIEYKDRSHFLAMASKTMRRVLVDHARKKKSAKRGGGIVDLTLDDNVVMAPSAPDILDLDNALNALAGVDEHLASTIELVFFGGLTYQEAADAQGVSKTALFDDMELAKAWLKNHMADMEEE
ncbi:MAG: ECF-type sigma factor [Woeseia sp.]